MILFVNACVRSNSRTKILCDTLLSKSEVDIEEVCLDTVAFPIMDKDFLNYRQVCIERNDFSDAYFTLAKQFARADLIVIGAPYWDLSFPASLKQYIEHINVIGLTFAYTPEGKPMGLCKAKKIYYISTAGGIFVPNHFGYEYIKTMANAYYGIQDVELIQAIGLDIEGNDAQTIMEETIQYIKDDIEI